MATLHERFSGLFIPHVTPFDEAGALDLESLSATDQTFFVRCPAWPDWFPARVSAKARC